MTSEVRPVPVRLCCGQRHWGAICPDGRVMCCVCYGRFSPDELYVDAHKDRWDVCLGCAPLTAHGKEHSEQEKRP